MISLIYVFVALPVQSALPSMQFTVSKYPCPFSPITLICVPNATGQIVPKTGRRNCLKVSIDKEVVNPSAGKMNSEWYSFAQIWYSCACWTSRCDESLWGKRSPSSTYLSHSALAVGKSFLVCNHSLIQSIIATETEFMQEKALKSDSVTGKVSSSLVLTHFIFL